MIALAIVCGCVIGILSCAPFAFARKKARGVNPTNSTGLLSWFLAATVLSFIILALAMLVCKLVAQDVFLPFSLTSIAVFVIGVIVFSLLSQKRK